MELYVEWLKRNVPMVEAEPLASCSEQAAFKIDPRNGVQIDRGVCREER